MPDPETGPRSSLLHVQTVRAEDGSSLSVAGHLCRAIQLQTVFAVFDLHIAVLLGGFCGGCWMDLDGGIWG